MQYGDEIAVTDSEKKITYLELNQKAICIGQYFMEKGICKDDKVLVQMPNRISFVAVLFALAKIRTVPIMMLPAHREAELEGIVDSVCHDMMLDPDWRNIADLIFKFIEKTIDKKSGDNYNDNYVSTQAHQGGE